MGNQQAIRPNLHQEVNSLESFKDKPSLPEDEQFLYAISGSRGWQLLKEYASQLMGELDAMVKAAIYAGASREEIGDRTLVAELAKEAIGKLIAKVEDAKQIKEQSPGSDGEAGGAPGDATA